MLSRQGIRHLRVTALLNDTTATLLALPGARLALICGTGVNTAAFLPTRLLHARKLPAAAAAHTHVVVNTECSMLGAGIFPLAAADVALDAAADLPGFQPLEQLVGGRYLGEIARRALGTPSERWSMRSENDGEDEHAREVVARVRERAGAFVAAMVAAFVDVLGERGALVVACAGAVIEGPVGAVTQRWLDELTGAGRVRLVVVEDAGLVGAAVAAVKEVETVKAML